MNDTPPPTPTEAQCTCDGYVMSLGAGHDTTCPVKRALDARARKTVAKLRGLVPSAPKLVSGVEASALPDGSVVKPLDAAYPWTKLDGKWARDALALGELTELPDHGPWLVLYRPALAVGDVVETAADLDRLPDESVIRDADDILFVKLGPLDVDPDVWAMPGDGGRFRPSLPAVVRDVPTGGAA